MRIKAPPARGLFYSKKTGRILCAQPNVYSKTSQKYYSPEKREGEQKTFNAFATIFAVSAENFNGADPQEGNETHLEKKGKVFGVEGKDFLMGKIIRESEFPLGIFTPEQLKQGTFILNFIGALYSFAVIGIVCGDYFLPSVDCICTDLNLSQDVAAATFMSFATTAPELFIILISTFLKESDIGVGAVVGSGMFNILGVATIGGLAASSPIKLDWWPLYRDSLVYMFAPISLAVVMSDGIVTLPEAAWLIVYYFLYFLIMLFNRSIRSRIKAWIKEINKKNKKDFYQANEATAKPPAIPTISLTLDDTKEVSNVQEPVKEDEEDNDDGSFRAYFMNYEDSISLRRVSACSNASSRSNRSRRKSDRSISLRKSSHATSAPPQAKLGDDLQKASSKLPDDSNKKDSATESAEGEGKENEDWAPVSLFTLPTGSLWAKFTWVVLWPSSFVLSHTIPNCRSTRWRKLYPITFLMCVFWIAISSYFGTWMISVVGDTFEISQSVMGLTFLALGGSMPEAISIFIMSRQGEGGLGFSNSLGGNTMDICLCLGLPWLVKCAVNGPITLESEGLQYNSIALVLGIIVLLSIATHTKFHMNKKMGLVCCIFYFLFIIISVLIEIEIIQIKTKR